MGGTEVMARMVRPRGAACRDDTKVSREVAIPGNRRLVCLVSDDPLMSRALARLLVRAGYEVVSGESCRGEVVPGGSRCPSLVIVDLPDDRSSRSGSAADRPVIQTSSACVLWIGDATEGGRRHEGHLAKPFTGSQLLSKVAALLTERSVKGC